RLLLLGRQLQELQLLADRERRQLRRVLVGVVLLLGGDTVRGEVARRLQGRARRAVDGAPGRDLGRRRVVDGRRHLRGDEAFPDQTVDLRLVAGDVLRDLVGRQVEVRRPDRLVRVLRVAPALEVTRRLGQRFVPVLLADVFADGA